MGDKQPLLFLTEQQQQQKPIFSSPKLVSHKKLILVSSIAAGIQFRWALQLSLLTPYIFPISGMIIQPIIGYHIDRCLSRWGRRRPFIISGTLLVIISVIFISFAADLGHSLGDPLGDTSSSASSSKPQTCFFMAVILLLTLTTIALTSSQEKPITASSSSSSSSVSISRSTINDVEMEEEAEANIAFGGETVKALRDLPRPMWVLLLVTCFNWIGWFPFLLFDTDWMGREVYGGKIGEGKQYGNGVRAGSFGLMFNSVVLGFTSLGWFFVNMVLSIGLASTMWITKVAESSREGTDEADPVLGFRISALALFAVLGVPLAVTYSIPFALASIFSNSSGAGQGLAMGVLNLAVVIPQILVSVASGPWDALFGGGNLPAFVVGAVAAAASGIVALTMLPALPPDFTNRSRIMRTRSSPFP
ncbi:hypothetical protein MKX01_018625 [Papaver californicum]|nr:hypothetical protein MKX01_018625 [Papaver californicum]